MNHLTADSDPRHALEAYSPDDASRVRQSRQRAERLQEFIRSHLPPHLDIEVIITPHVATAAVLPADLDAILDAETTDVGREQAERLLDGVDADYLVLVTGTAAALDRIPLNDQLTADHAHQFGLAFHELLHILKTAIVAIGRLLDAEIDERYHGQVHDLINIIEDGAIEGEAIQGDTFSDNAGIRLELTRRIHSQTPDDVPDDQHLLFSFWDAVTSSLYDLAIYPTGVTDALLDADDARIDFKSEADRQVFEAVHDAIHELAQDALAIRGVDPNDPTRSHDKHASVLRAKRVIEAWNTVIQPIIESGQLVNHEGTSEDHRPEVPGVDQPVEGSNGAGQIESEPSKAERGGEIDSDDGQSDESLGAGSGADGAAPGSPEHHSSHPSEIDPDDVSLDREVTVDPYQDVFDHPAITPDPGPDSGGGIDEDQWGADIEPVESSVSSDGNRGETHPPGGQPFEPKPDPAPSINDVASPEGKSSDQESQSREQSLAEAAARVRETDLQGDGRDSETESVPTPIGTPSGAVSTPGQLTFDDIVSTAPSKHAKEPDSLEGEQRPPESIIDEHGTASSASSPARADDTGAHPDTEGEPIGPAHGRGSKRSTGEDREVYEDALEADRRAAHDEATRESIDQTALERELNGLRQSLDRERRHRDDAPDVTDSTRGGPGHLDEIELLPVVDELVPPREWAAIEDGAHHVAGTLAKELRRERQRGDRVGLTAGTYDTRAGHRLAIGDPRVCKTRIPGREKRYCLVLVLDRSGSMRNGSPAKIEVATQALARFAVAAEELGIAVGVIDFIHGNARLVKPFSVETRHVQATLLETACGGGTPLADAIGLARTLVETHRDEPLIITVTDDEPQSVDAVIEQIRQSHAPVCSLTVATDCPPGTLSPDASELSRYYERQATVYTSEGLDDRLDQFASLLAGF